MLRLRNNCQLFSSVDSNSYNMQYIYITVRNVHRTWIWYHKSNTFCGKVTMYANFSDPFPKPSEARERLWSLCPFDRALPGRAENDRWSLMISRVQSFQSNEKGLHVLFIYASRFERKRKEARIKFNFRMLYTTIRVYVIWYQRCTPISSSQAPISIKTTFYPPEVWMLSCTMIQAPVIIKDRWSSRIEGRH